MTPERWRQVEELLDAALSRSESERAAFLGHACAGDVALRREVDLLLAQQASMGGFLEDPAVAIAAPMGRETGASVLTGRRLGVYQVQALLGVGGMGEVYRAHDTRLRRDVAIKILPRAFTSDPDRLARFEREARVLASLNHPHVGAIYGLEESEGIRALVLELVAGDTLAERIARAAGRAGREGRGPGSARSTRREGSEGSGLPMDQALQMARQIADALDAAHEKGIVHRDLKPANIKITPAGVVKVLDFGLAKPHEPSDVDLTDAPTVTAIDTGDGAILGTAAYMSPEQARGQAVDKRTDIWAFGCVLYEMLADARPSLVRRSPIRSRRSSTVIPTGTPCLDRRPPRSGVCCGDVSTKIRSSASATSVMHESRSRMLELRQTRPPRKSHPVASPLACPWLVAAASIVALLSVASASLFRPAPDRSRSLLLDSLVSFR